MGGILLDELLLLFGFQHNMRIFTERNKGMCFVGSGAPRPEFNYFRITELSKIVKVKNVYPPHELTIWPRLGSATQAWLSASLFIGVQVVSYQ